MNRATGLMAAMIAAFATTARADDPPVDPAAAVLEMRLVNGALEGPGADAILSRVPGAQFILVGEDHGFADAPEIALALAHAARPHGMVHHVVETGPVSADWAGAILKRDGVEALAAALDGRPLALPFLWMREDAELARFFVESAPRRRDALWGVDQEFIFSTPLHFETLEKNAATDEARALARSHLDADMAALASGAQGKLFLSAAGQEEFAALEAAFEGDAPSLKIIGLLMESAAIYQLYNAGANYASNARRVELIATAFGQAYRAGGGEAPRALFKMGAIHLGRGSTFLNTFDLGSLTEGVAAANGLDVLRVLVLPLAGEQTNVAPSADGAFRTGPSRSSAAADLLAALGLEDHDLPEGGYAVVALAPAALALEQEGIDGLKPATRFFLLGYDYLVTTKSARGATPLAVK